MFKDVIYLVSETEAQDDYGQIVGTNAIKKQVFADLKSVGRNEFYQAQTAGFNPKLIFHIRKADFAFEKKVEYDGEEYRVIRTYESEKTGEFIELICEAWTT